MMRQLSAIVMFFSVASAMSAGFDCGDASTRVEKLICADPELERLDEQLTLLYSRTKYRASPYGAEQLTKQQRIWLRTRDRCRNSECVASVYRERIEHLGGSVEQR